MGISRFITVSRLRKYCLFICVGFVFGQLSLNLYMCSLTLTNFIYNKLLFCHNGTQSCFGVGQEYLNYPLKINLWEQVEKEKSGLSTSVIPITSSTYEYLIENSNKCDSLSSDRKRNLVILIKSNVKGLAKRNAIRQTWGIESCIWNNWIIKRIFLLASHSQYSWRSKIIAENNIYGDIVQQDFIDHYYNNTWKTIMGIDWLTKYCRSASYALFVDDDFLIYPNVLTDYLNQLGNNKIPFISGFKQYNAMIFRDQTEKHYVSYREIDWKCWPPYLSAGAFILNIELAFVLQPSMKYVKYFRFDDIFLGIVLYKLGIEVEDIKDMLSLSIDEPITGPGLIASHGFNETHLIDIWKRFNLDSSCIYRK